MKKSYFIFAIAISCLCILSCNAGNENKDDSSKSAGFDMGKARVFIDSINTKWSEELKKGDSTALAAHYSPDGKILLTNNEPISGAGILSFWGSIVRSGMTDWKFITTDLEGNSNFLIETGAYEINNPDKKLVDKGNYVVTWKRQDNGEWKLYRDIGVSTMPGSSK